MKPNLDSDNIGWVPRTTDSTWPSEFGVLSVRTLSAPISKPPYCPDNLSPTLRLTGVPDARPILREQNGLELLEVLSWELRAKLRPPNSKAATSCKKKTRVSGVKREKRVVLTCRTSRGAWEKWGFTVNVSVSAGVIL